MRDVSRFPFSVIRGLLGCGVCVVAGVIWFGPLAQAADFPPYDGTKERDAFWAFHNKKVLTNLQGEEKRLTEEVAKAKDATAKTALEAELNTVRERLKKPEFFTFATSADVPADLQWEDGMDQPDIGDPAAKKGGTMRLFIPGFPATLRVTGENANGSFRGYQSDDVELGLLGTVNDSGVHPETGRFYPGIAKQWAVGADNRTVYFRIDPEARFSNGDPIEVEDFFNRIYIELSEYPKNPYGNEYFTTQFSNFTRYDARTMSVTMPEPKPRELAPYYATFSPSSRRYFAEFGPDFEQRYQWRPRVATGAYYIREEDINFGRSITLTRAKDWWAKDKKFWRNRYNVDRIVYRVIRLQEKALELLRQGELDGEELMMGIPEYWYEKTEVPEVHRGYICKAKFFNVWPGTEAGLWLNTAVPPLNNKELRVGLCYATNYQKVIDFDLRGDFQRLRAFSEGYALLGDADITPRPFDPAKAREHFAKAGYTKPGPDGVLVNAKGERLSITILHKKLELVQKVMQRLKEEALKCGLEYKLEGMDTTAYFQKATQKKHQAVSVAYNISPPIPDHHQHFHSSNAFMEDGKTMKPNNNNLCSYADPVMDKLCEEERHATSLDELRRAAHACDQIVHDEALWIPGYDQSFYRVAYWRWVKFPEKTFNLAASTLAFASHIHWIDEAVKTETLEAMRRGQTFPEVDLVFDHNLKRSPATSEAPKP